MRYEIRVFSRAKIITSKDKKPVGVFYGVWDTRNNNWVINATGIGKHKAERILKALQNNNNINKMKPFWRE